MVPILLVIALSVAFYFCLKSPFTYWSKKGVQQKSIFNQLVETIRLLFGVTSMFEIICQRYKEFSDKRYVGSYYFFKPILFLTDPDLIKQITVRDFDYFSDRIEYIPAELEPLWGKNLLALKGDQWRDMRATLNPLFTGIKMQKMFNLIDKCALKLTCYLKEKVSTDVEMKNVFARYSNDVIASTAFGVTCDSLTDSTNKFYSMGQELTMPSGFWKKMALPIVIITPKFAHLLGIKGFPTEVCEFFKSVVKTNIELREKNEIVLPDLIHLLMEAKKSSFANGDVTKVTQRTQSGKEELVKSPLTDDDLTAQALIFFLAGYEAASSVMGFLVYELAMNPYVQQKLRNEVDNILKYWTGSLNYEELVKMEYMDMVLSETLRKWPPSVYTDRVCVKPYTIQPVRKGEKPLRMEKGEAIMLPILGIHRHAGFYSNPDEFDPERFNYQNKANMIPNTYIPFSAGPRSCIAMKFALTEIKTVIFHLISKFEILCSEKTPKEISIAKDRSFLNSKNGFWVKLKPRPDVCRYY